ncbi:transglutaminase domain-containing protein [Pontibacter sp. KCTC 32443]|uniref:transglutaminase-like domain-containing protein n=1 Tax=Pontibacter TaxID=323449 RepID=UPI00164D5F0A|nr:MULTISPECIES: transglutaminase-like domain-containing protein [Pontibacter]MBC5775558.1 transglutaminase domain-containing protein [Pontibacter sp. KCTC 32443]
MKKSLSSLFVLLMLVVPAIAQKTYKGLPVIAAKNAVADYKIGSEWVRGNWNVSPQIEVDVMQVPVPNNKVKFAFHTDSDSISFNVKPGKSHKFYVLLNGKDYALTEIKGYGFVAQKFNETNTIPAYTLIYEQNKNNDFLNTLREQYNLDEIVKGATNDTERALRMVNWVHKQWKHNGMNEPSKPDALTILAEAKAGKQFRCVEYGTVTAASLNAIGLPARRLGLKTKDVETTQYGAGHVLLEVYLPDLKKWVMLDGQFDVMPVLNNVPLNAVEFQQAIANNYNKLEIRSLSGTSKAQYVNWIYPYLYYFDVRFDNREGVAFERQTVDSKKSLMLIPVGAKQPKVFQITNPLDYCKYTNSIVDFYQPPVMGNKPTTALR